MDLIKLGTCVNLINGYNPQWLPGNCSKGLFAVPKMALTEIDAVISSSPGTWSYPLISLHDNAESLLSELFPFSIVNPSNLIKEAELAAGNLLIGDKDRSSAIASLSTLLGVDLSNTDQGFALVQLRRDSGSGTHPVVRNGLIVSTNSTTPDPTYGISEEFRQALIGIRSGKNIYGKFDPQNFNADNANDCINFFETWGSHFISKVNTGDIIFQVFAYSSTLYKKVQKVFTENDFSGMNAANFTLYTTDANTGSFGYVNKLGNLLSFSGSNELESDLNSGNWNDSEWSGGNSIFAPVIGNTGIDFIKLNASYTEDVAIAYELTSLSMFAENVRRSALKRVFKGAMIQKFKDAVTPHFEVYSPYTNIGATIQGSDIPGFISTIVTPNINTYKPVFDLSNFQFVAGDTANIFSLCTNLLSSSISAGSIPGKDVAILVQVADFESDNSINYLTLSDDAISSYQFFCGKFYGCLLVVNQSGTQNETILDGLKYANDTTLDSNSRFKVRVTSDIRLAPTANIINRMKDNLSFSFTFADSIIGSFGSNQGDGIVNVFVTDTLRWMSNAIPQTITDTDLLDLRVRTLDTLRVLISPSNGVYVPLLPPDVYKEQVESILNYTDKITRQIDQYQTQINDRKEQELIINVGNALNSNIISSGQLLVGFVQANASQLADMATYYSAVISQKQVELSSAQDRINTMQLSVDSQRANLQNAISDYKSGVKNWETMQEIQAGLDFANNLFSLATSIVIPASSIGAVKDLGLSVQRIQKTLNVLNSSFKIYNSLNASVDMLKNAQDALDSLQNSDFDISTSLDWDVMNANMSYILNTGPSIPEKNELQNAFQILLLRGKALLSAKDAANQLGKDIYNQQRLQTLNQTQLGRLNAINTSLQPENIPNLDPSTLDLIGMTGSLMFIRNQMLGILAKTFLLHDQALQYQNLQPATVITDFDLLSFYASIQQQETNKVTALTKLNAVQSSVTTPINITIQIPATKLTQGNVYELPIMLDNSNFTEYMDARIQSVMVQIVGVKGTDSGNYAFTVVCEGSPFSDRDMSGNPIVFRTRRRERTYEFNAVNNQPNFTDNGETWSENVNPVTPFSTWSLCFPDIELNKNISFSDVMVGVTLAFTLNARINTNAMSARKTYVNKKNDDRPMSSFLSAVSIIEPSLTSFLSGMAGVTVLNGWDVVFNMSLDKIQTALNNQYDSLKASTDYGGKISMTSINTSYPGVNLYKKFDMAYGYPQLVFQPNDSANVKLNIPIESGTLIAGTQLISDPLPPIIWGAPTTVDAGASISATIPLSQIAGLVTGSPASGNIFSVAINMSSGTFIAKNLAVDDDDDKAAFNTALTNYFVSNPITFIINSLNLTQISTLPDMQPTSFRMKTLITETNNNQVMQLFIMTNNRQAPDISQASLNNVPEPIPMGSDCSLIISSKILFNSILPQSLNKKGWQLQGVDPGDNKTSWSSKLNQGSISATLDLSSLDYTAFVTVPSIYPLGESTQDYIQTYYYVDGGKVDINLNGMIFSPSANDVNVSFSQQETQSFTIETIRTGSIYYDTKMPETSDYTLNISTIMPLTIGGTDSNQTISFNINPSVVTITGDLSSGGSCGNADVQGLCNQQLASQLPQQVTDQVNVSFTDVSVFALENLLFTGLSTITLQNANVPGDVVLTGVFN